MRINRQVVVFDAADLEAESTFWAGVLDGTVDAEDDWHMVMVDDEPRVGVQLAPNHVAPDWPDGTPEQQIHLDLWVDDFPEAHDRVMTLGAKVLKPAAADADSPHPITSRSTRILPDIRSASAGFNDTSSSSSYRLSRLSTSSAAHGCGSCHVRVAPETGPARVTR
jgi:Glyoxalase-like domain